MINLKLKTIFSRWTDDNKAKAIETIGDDEMKNLLNYDRPRAFELFKQKLDEEYFNGLFDEYYKPIKEAQEEKKANSAKRTVKTAGNKIEEIDMKIKELQNQIAKLQAERVKAVNIEKEKTLKETLKMVEKLSPEQRAALLASLQQG